MLGTNAPGLLLVSGGIDDGKTTVAKAWVVGQIKKHGRQAVYARAPHLLRLPQYDVGEEISRLGAVECLALDDLAAGTAPYKSWEADRIAEVLSLRKGRQTLLTTPCALRSATGPLLQHRAGSDLTARLLKGLVKSSGRPRVFTLGGGHE